MDRSGPWLRSAWWDVACLGFCWVPFYVWVVGVLGLGRQAWGLDPLRADLTSSALALASWVALGITYVHRHYTLLVVYGDRGVFAERALNFLVAPLLLCALITWAYATNRVWLRFGKVELTSWGVVTVVGITWNAWHTVSQRYGLWRAYAGRLGKGLQRPEHARRDRALLWSFVAATIVLTLTLQAESLDLHPTSRFIGSLLGTTFRGPSTGLWLALAFIPTCAVGANWVRHEFSAPIALADRLPRLVFLASSLMLFAVFAVHGPVVGYLCFGVAHAIEYVAFVHHFSEKKYARGSRSGVAGSLLKHASVGAPLLILGLLGAYWLLEPYRSSGIYRVYYVATSWAHFLFDGLIWKIRKPNVAQPLGIERNGLPRDGTRHNAL